MNFRVLTRFYYRHNHTRKNAPPPGGHVFHTTGTIFIGTHVPTKFHEDWTKNVTSRVLTRFHYSTIRKNAQTPAAMFFKRPQLFSNSPQISLKTNVLTKFYEDNKCHFSSVNKVSKQTHPSGGHNFQWTKTVCELGWDIIRTNVMTKFYYDLNKNLTLRLFPSFFVLNSA